MNKIRQFSFQDYIASKQSEGTLDSVDSTLSSCRNKDQQCQDTSESQGTENDLFSQNVLKAYNSNNGSEKALVFKAQETEKENINVTQSGQKASINQKSIEKLFENISPGKKKVQNQNQKENCLEDNWKKLDKINRMLEEHRKKKAQMKKQRTPLGQVDENIDLGENDQNDYPELAERADTAQFLLEDQKRSGKKNSSPGTPVEDKPQEKELENLISYADIINDQQVVQERPEQPFSTTLHEPFSPDKPFLVVLNQNQNQNQRNQISFAQENKEEEEKAPVLASQRSRSVKSFGEYYNHTEKAITSGKKLDFETIDNESINGKSLSIVERLRLKDKEREMRLQKLREEKARKEMGMLRAKPKISENSAKIAAQSSKRSRETEEVLERLLTEPKRSVYVTSPKSALDTSQGQRVSSQSKLDNKSFRTEGNQNIYKRSSRNPSVTITSSNAHKVEPFRSSIETRQRYETMSEMENQQMELPEDANKLREPSNLELIEPTSSDTSLHREASQRLKMAMARKTAASQDFGLSSQASQGWKQEEALKSDSSIPISPSTHQPLILFEKKKELPSGTKINYKTRSEVFQTESAYTEQTSVRTARSPKHVYLKMSSQFTEAGDQEGAILTPSLTSNSSTKNLGTEGFRRAMEQNINMINLDNASKEYMDEFQRSQSIKNSQQNQAKFSFDQTNQKGSAIQTLSATPKMKKTANENPKPCSYGGSPNYILHQNNEEEENRRSQKENNENLNKESGVSNRGKPSKESLLNSWRLRQQKFSQNSDRNSTQTEEENVNCISSLRLKDENRNSKPNLTLGQNTPSGGVDVYLRNALWLSAKNEKIASLNVVKEQKEMNQCTFRPKIVEKGQNSGMYTPKTDGKSLDITSERNRDKAKETARVKRTALTYRDLHATKGKSLEQQQNTELKTPISSTGQENLEGGESKQNPVEIREENGEILYLL